MRGTRFTLEAPLAATAWRLAAGAILAGVLGSSAGAALRPQDGERYWPAAPQQICEPSFQLAALEAAGGGWPNRRPG